MITDAHMHVGEFPLFDVRLDRASLAGYLADNSIDVALIFNPDNDLVRDTVHEVEGAYGLFWANPKEADCLPRLRDALDDPLFRGVKMHPLLDGYHPNEPFVWPIVETLVERGLPALIHCGHPIFTLPWSIEELVVNFEEAKIILGHMGHGNIVYIDGAIAVAERHPNVWLETSGMPMSSKILEGVRRVGSDRVMYGSDGPFHQPRVEQLKVELAGLDAPALADVMSGTAQRLFFGADAVLP